MTRQIAYIQETSSTLTYIRELQKEQLLEDGFTVYTGFQSAGRGQKGNSWESAQDKNLLFSTILFPPKLKANQQFIISQLVSLAIFDVLNKETDQISIKWPNDIYWKNKKIAGILIENDIMEDMIYRSILGVGINLNQEAFESKAPNPVSLKQITGKSYEIIDILFEILKNIDQYYNSLESPENFTTIRKRYKESLYRKDGFHRFANNNETFDARIYDIEESGILVLETQDGDIRRYAFKEVRYINDTNH